MNQNYYTWNSETPIPVGKTKITVLSGFLGTGKTTLLNSFIAKSGMENVVVLVNDVGEINVDASLIRSSSQETGTALKQVMELTSGCICCSANSDLASAIFSLIMEYSPEQIIVESSGVAEPGNTFASLFVPNGYGKKISDLLDFQNMITLVNPDYFVEKWESAQSEKKRTHLLLSDPRQPLIELLISQIEFSDLIVLTHADQCEESVTIRAKLLARSLNSHAEIIEGSNGDVDPQMVIRKRFDGQNTPDGTRWRSLLKNHEIPHGHNGHSHRDYGITTWLYRARKPFGHSHFVRIMKQEFSGVIRAKGFYWSDEQPDRAGFLSLAANYLRMDFTGDWFAVMCDQGRKSIDQIPESLAKVWDDTLGDRRQEIVFIGIDMDIETMQNQLDGCLR